MTVNNHGGSSDEYHNERVKEKGHESSVQFCTNTWVKRKPVFITAGFQDLHSYQGFICKRKNKTKQKKKLFIA